MEFRILTVAWMQKECLLIIVSENWTHILSSGIWTYNFQSRTSEMELRTLTLAVMQKKTVVYCVGKLNSYF